MIDTESSISDLSERDKSLSLICRDSGPHTNVGKAVERIATATCYREPTIMDRIQRVADQAAPSKVQRLAAQAKIHADKRAPYLDRAVPKPTPKLEPTDRRFAVTASELHIKDIELPRCPETHELMREEALRVKMLSSAGIIECAACNGGGHVYENLSKFVETGGVKVKCSACKGSGEYSGSEYEKQGFGTVPTPHDDVVDALAYALPPLTKRNSLVYGT